MLFRSRGGRAWSAGRIGLQLGDRSGDLRAPGPGCGDAQPPAAASAGDAPGGGEQAQPKAFGFPSAGGAVQGEHLHPGQQLAGHRDDLAPELVLRESLEGQVAQPGVFRGADAVLAPGPAAVAQLQVSELSAFRAGGEGSEPVAVDVSEAKLGANALQLVELVQEDLFGDEADAEFAGGTGFA